MSAVPIAESFRPASHSLAERFALLAHISLALYLVGLLSVPRVSSTLAGMTALLALMAIVTARFQTFSAGFGARPRPTGPPVLPMLALLGPALGWAVVVLIQIGLGMTTLRVGNQVLIIALVTAIGLSRVPVSIPDVRQLLLPAAALGALLAGALAMWQLQIEGLGRPHGWLGGGPLGSGAIKFGNLSAVLALLAFILSISSRGWRRGLGILGVAGGMMALGLSQTRGGLLGVLLAIVVLTLAIGWRRWRTLRLSGRAISPKERFRTGVAIMVATGLLVAVASPMLHRFADIEPQLERYQKGDAHSEIGQRIAMWSAALRTGQHAPGFGVGIGGYAKDLERQSATGQIPPNVHILYGQPHNEYLSGLTAAGVPGLLLMLALFWWPVIVLFRALIRGHDNPGVRAALVVSTAFAGFALTDSLFDRQITVIAFLLLSAWLMRIAAEPGAIGRPVLTDSPVADRPLTAPVGSATESGAGLMPAGRTESIRSVMPVRLSVAIITKNEAHRIERCLASVAFADQIVVVDSGSSDDTVARARRAGAEVTETEDWPGFGIQKNRALALCRAPWVLSIDADEVVDENLRRAIEAVIADDLQPADPVATVDGVRVNGYWLVRRSRFCGQAIHFGNWRNDHVLRLFRRELGSFSNDLVHERVVCPQPLARLAGSLEHDSIDSLEDAREKTVRYARAGAVLLRSRGRGGQVSAWTHALWGFARGYLLRLGFLDGRNGLRLAWLGARGTYWRYRWAVLPDDVVERECRAALRGDSARRS